MVGGQVTLQMIFYNVILIYIEVAMPLTLVPQYPYMYLLSLAPDLSLFEVLNFFQIETTPTLRSNGGTFGNKS